MSWAAKQVCGIPFGRKAASLRIAQRSAQAEEDLHPAQLVAECTNLEARAVELRERLQCEEAWLHHKERAAGGSHFMMGCGISFIVLAVVGVIGGGCFIIWFVYALGSALGSGGIRC